MLYDLSQELAKEQFKKRCNFLYAKGAVVEMTEKAVRSLKQNSYLHSILAYFAIQYGESLEFVKTRFYKEAWNPDLFIVEKDDPIIGKTHTLKSSRDLNKEEMSLSIERFRNHASKDAGIYIPSADEHKLVELMEMEVKKYEKYL